MTFYLDDHKVKQDDPLNIAVTDEPGSGGAHHRYEISGLQLLKNKSIDDLDYLLHDRMAILFQNGPIPTNGVNGVTVEALLTLCKHRLECFQAGPFACTPNEEALNHITLALETLKDRTRERLARNVEGKEVK